jgi:hypothetical protein
MKMTVIVDSSGKNIIGTARDVQEGEKGFNPNIKSGVASGVIYFILSI